MPVLERSALESSSLADLHSIASELSIDSYRTLRKEELIEKIVNHNSKQQGSSRRSAAGGQRSRRESRSASRDRGSSRSEKEQVLEGTVETRRGGSAFLRLSEDGPTDEDPYISAAQVRRCELKKGDKVSGPVRPPRRSERYPSLARVETVNGKKLESTSSASASDKAAPRSRQSAKPKYPSKLFGFSADAELSKLEKTVPFGLGSRVSVVGDAFSGKSELLKRVAAQLKDRKDIDLKVTLTGVRPEELSEWQDSLGIKPVATVKLGAKDTERMSAVRKTVQAAKRSLRNGKDAVVLVDSVAGLDREFVCSILSEAQSTDSGSLTVITASTEPVGGESTVIALSSELAAARKYPALDLAASGAVKAELLLSARDLKAAAKAVAKASR